MLSTCLILFTVDTFAVDVTVNVDGLIDEACPQKVLGIYEHAESSAHHITTMQCCRHLAMMAVIARVIVSSQHDTIWTSLQASNIRYHISYMRSRRRGALRIMLSTLSNSSAASDALDTTARFSL